MLACPRNLTVQKNCWRVGDLDAPGREVRLTPEIDDAWLGPRPAALLGSLAAVRIDRSAQMIPLRRARSGYVDWYAKGR